MESKEYKNKVDKSQDGIKQKTMNALNFTSKGKKGRVSFPFPEEYTCLDVSLSNANGKAGIGKQTEKGGNCWEND